MEEIKDIQYFEMVNNFEKIKEEFKTNIEKIDIDDRTSLNKIFTKAGSAIFDLSDECEKVNKILELLSTYKDQITKIFSKYEIESINVQEKPLDCVIDFCQKLLNTYKGQYGKSYEELYKENVSLKNKLLETEENLLAKNSLWSYYRA